VAWSRVLAPVAAVYAGVAAGRRARADSDRRPMPGLYVIAVGNLTVGGAGKTSLARWLTLQALAAGARPAVLLRGHGRRRRGPDTWVVPDFEGYPLRSAFEQSGDEAAFHRAALPPGATVIVDRDRYRAAAIARAGYGATVAVLDDGWEQARLRWDELWVAVDPRHPVGNGSLLPAGPLRRPAATLREANVIAVVLEAEDEDVPAETVAWVRALAPRAPLLRFLRCLDGTSSIGGHTVEPWTRPASPFALLSGVGSPARVERFARSHGIDVVFHAAFPDHAAWNASEVERALRAAARAGATGALITEKDEPRWPEGVRPPIPTRVLRTSLRAIDPVDRALAPMRVWAASPVDEIRDAPGAVPA
jgi:tetraacyldisaccharide 4'-kinase